MNELHNVLAAVLKATGASPPGQPGPKPLLYNPTYVELAAWLADRVAAKVRPAEKKHFRRLVELARPVRRPRQLGKRELDELVRLRDLESEAPAFRVARELANEALECHRHSSCGAATRHAALAAAEVLGGALVLPLQRELVRLDAVTLMQRQHLTAPSPVAATLWRGSTGAKTTHWLVRLSDDSHALIGKTRGRWTLLLGSREDMLASVPDALMGSAVETVLGGAAAAPPTTPLASVVITPPAPVTQVELSADGATVYAQCGKRRLAWSTASGEPRSAPPPKVIATQPPSRARWAAGEKAKTIELEGAAFSVEKGNITRVAEAGDRVLVAYHHGRRLTSFDPQGKRGATLDVRDLGETVQELIPLRRGLVFGFAPYPRGMILILDPEARVVASVRLGVRFAGGQTAFFDGGAQVALAYSHKTSGNCLVVLRFG